MAAQLRFIVQATEAQALEFTAESPGDRLAERCFPHPGWTDEAENRRLGRRIQLQNAEVFENAFLDFAQIIMVLVQYLPGAGRYPEHLRSRFSTATRARIPDKCG